MPADVVSLADYRPYIKAPVEVTIGLEQKLVIPFTVCFGPFPNHSLASDWFSKVPAWHFDIQGWEREMLRVHGEGLTFHGPYGALRSLSVHIRKDTISVVSKKSTFGELVANPQDSDSIWDTVASLALQSVNLSDYAFLTASLYDRSFWLNRG